MFPVLASSRGNEKPCKVPKGIKIVLLEETVPPILAIFLVYTCFQLQNIALTSSQAQVTVRKCLAYFFVPFLLFA